MDHCWVCNSIIQTTDKGLIIFPFLKARKSRETFSKHFHLVAVELFMEKFLLVIFLCSIKTVVKAVNDGWLPLPCSLQLRLITTQCFWFIAWVRVSNQSRTYQFTHGKSISWQQLEGGMWKHGLLKCLTACKFVKCTCELSFCSEPSVGVSMCCFTLAAVFA